jgi:hypothetical protein
MHLASPSSPAHVAVSSDIMKKSFSVTCQPPERRVHIMRCVPLSLRPVVEGRQANEPP